MPPLPGPATAFATDRSAFDVIEPAEAKAGAHGRCILDGRRAGSRCTRVEVSLIGEPVELHLRDCPGYLGTHNEPRLWFRCRSPPHLRRIESAAKIASAETALLGRQKANADLSVGAEYVAGKAIERGCVRLTPSPSSC